MFKNKCLCKYLAVMAMFGTAATALAQDAAGYPSRTIRYIVGYTPGGTADMLARAVGQKLAAAWGQQVIVDNRPGAGTNIGTELGAKAPPDGYTLFMPTVANAINPTLYPKLNYDMLKDFVYVTNFAKVPGIVVVHPSLPAKNAKDLIAIAKANPDSLRHGSTGIGSPHHLAGEIFKTMAGVKMVHVPYKGATPAIADIIAGHIEVYFGAMVSTLPHARAGGDQPETGQCCKRCADAGRAGAERIRNRLVVRHGSAHGHFARYCDETACRIDQGAAGTGSA